MVHTDQGLVYRLHDPSSNLCVEWARTLNGRSQQYCISISCEPHELTESSCLDDEFYSLQCALPGRLVGDDPR